MRKTCFTLLFLSIFACGEKNEKAYRDTADVLKIHVDRESQEEDTRQFIEDYMAVVNSPDWKTKAVQYLRNPDAFLEEHSVFRLSFPDYKTTIKHLTVDGSEGIVWLQVDATYATTYDFENSTYGDGILRNARLKISKLTWEETWYFNVVDGKFGQKFDILKDNYAVLKGLGAVE